MTQRLEAVFEGGVFKPARPISLAEGTRVQVVMETRAWRDNAQTMARTIAEIAASAPPGGQRENTSGHVDQILYGEGYGR